MTKTHSVITMPTIKVDAYLCSRCGHVWLPREPTKRENRPPILCAKCKSAYWNVPRPEPKIQPQSDKKLSKERKQKK